MMLNKEIARLKDVLNTLIAKNADYAEILKVSRELDKLIAKVSQISPKVQKNNFTI
ncbi:MAG: hypothetical protein K0S30_2174 [Clostridia bacterium]|nr:hypothetical protein [Clostridia bacterium]